jgi:hypothetical protein
MMGGADESKRRTTPLLCEWTALPSADRVLWWGPGPREQLPRRELTTGRRWNCGASLCWCGRVCVVCFAEQSQSPGRTVSGPTGPREEIGSRVNDDLRSGMVFVETIRKQKLALILEPVGRARERPFGVWCAKASLWEWNGGVITSQLPGP